ncbi:cytochrome P450 [Diaporthe eres]|nr:cytochrome P450 [Diaporthe eres]
MACPYKKEPNLKPDDVVEPSIDGPGEPIPHPPEKWLIGNAGEIDPAFFISSVWRFADIYGPIYSLKLFGRSVVVVSSYELVNEVCDEARFEKTTKGNLETLRALVGSGLFTAYSDEHDWYVGHRILIPAMGPIAVRRMFDQMVDCVSQMILKWDRLGPDHEVSGPDDFSRLTFDVIGLCAMNYRFNCFYAEEPPRFMTAMAEALVEAGKATNRMAVENALRYFSRRRMAENIEYMHSICDGVIAERRASPRPELNDLLNVMMHGKDPVSGESMSDELISNEFLTFLIAGHETTSGTMNFMMYNLLKHPDKLQKCYQERHSKRETVIGGKYRIQPDWAIMLNLRGLHHDTSVYGADADEFRPERFLEGGWEQNPQNAWKAFGTGARGCPGKAIAEQEMITAWALIFQRFNIELADPEYQLKIKPTLTIKPDDLRFKVRRRPGKDRMVGLAGAPHKDKVYPAAGQRKTARHDAGKESKTDKSADLKPLSIFFGGISNTCKTYGEDFQHDAPGFGFQVPDGARNLDEAVENLPKDRPVLIITSSYEGQPPDNAKGFVAWLEARAAAGDDNLLKGVSYAVFGAGNKDWVRTFHRSPRLVDSLMEQLGATRIALMGLVDVSEDILGPWEDWKAGLVPVLRKLSGATAEVTAEEIEVEVVHPGAPAKLAGPEMASGIVLSNTELVKAGVGPQKKHMEVLLPPGQRYQSGDYLVVLPVNPREQIRRVMNRFGLHPDDLLAVTGTSKEYLTGFQDEHMAAYELIGTRVELATPASQRQVATLAAKLPTSEGLKTLVSDISAYRSDVLEKRVSVLDLLEEFPSCDLSFAEYLAMLQPLAPRQYSISSTPLAYPPVPSAASFPRHSAADDDSTTCLTCSIIYDVLKGAPALSGRGSFTGVASSYLSNLPPGSRLRCSVRGTASSKFRLPPDPKTPVVMVAAGTGIAAMRAFVQERAAVAGARGGPAALGPAVLFYGCRDHEEDFLYGDELAAWEAAGAVTVRPAFSRRAPQEQATAHVDEVVWAEREVVRDLFKAGARVLVCGSASRLGRSTHEVCVRIYREGHPEVSAEEAEEWMLKQKEDRYLSDVFG